MKDFKLVPTSNMTAIIEPAILLSEKETRQTVFQAMQVDNSKEASKNINGKLLYKKKSKSNDSFDLVKLSKKDIKSNEYIEIQLDTSETFNLAKGLKDLYYSLYGKLTPLESTKYVKTDESFDLFAEMMQSKPDLVKLLSQIDLSSINVALNYENIKRIKNDILGNLDNDEEVIFWQNLFLKNSWILSQLFACPYYLLNDEGYVGGKNLSNKNGKYVDYIYKNKLTNNIALIEIKTPTENLLRKKQYRGDDVFAISDNLSGAINQLLAYKDRLLKEFTSLAYNGKEKFEALNFECLLIVGKLSSLDEDQLKCFELYRGELKSIKIVCYDELLDKINSMLSLLTDKTEN